MGFGNRVRQQGKETYKLKLTNKNYKYYKLLESGKQVVGPVSTQARTDANIVMGLCITTIGRIHTCHIQTDSSPLACHEMNAKLNKNCFRHSKFTGGGIYRHAVS
jgi:hypothetical protein